MAIYHIREDGNPGRCKAVVHDCPYGGPADHYLDKNDARAAYELRQGSPMESSITHADINTNELEIIDAKLLRQAIKLAAAENGAQRELVEAATEPIAIIRAVRIEEREIFLHGSG